MFEFGTREIDSMKRKKKEGRVDGYCDRDILIFIWYRINLVSLVRSFVSWNVSFLVERGFVRMVFKISME